VISSLENHYTNVPEGSPIYHFSPVMQLNSVIGETHALAPITLQSMEAAEDVKA
jgi:hypothetical protein